jgi:hypothetical protein
MEKLTSKLEEFNQTVVNRIEELMETKGVKSQHSSKNVLCVASEDTMFNLEGGRWLVEITPTALIDNGGYEYGFDSLSLENLCIVIDEIADAITPNFRVGTMDSHGTGEEFVYFEDEEIAYNSFIDKRATESEVWMEKRVENRHGEFEFETLHSYSADEDED